MDRALQTYMSFVGTANSTEIPNQDDEILVDDLFNSHDWSSSPLGPIDTWGPTLKSTVNLCLHSVFPIAIYYGPDLITIYNQMCVPILKMKHPQAMGRPFREIWPEIYDEVKPLFEGDGYFEESYFSFTLSPIFKEDGSVGGVFNAVQETTQRVLSNRRLKTLSELGNRTPGAKSVESACHLVTQTLREKKDDIPYAFIYLVESSSTKSSSEPQKAHLIASTFDEDLDFQKCEDGVDEITFVPDKSRRVLPDHLLITENTIDLTIVPDEINELINDNSDNSKFGSLCGIDEKIVVSADFLSSWPLQYVSRKNSHIVVTLKNGSKAILYPISSSKDVLTAFIILGINPNRALDKEYIEFLQLVVGQVSVSLTHGKSREEERKQAEILADLNKQKIMFFQNISHELRTPITLMLSPLDEVISLCPRDTPIFSHLCMIQRNTKRLLKLVNTLLQFSRIEAGRMEAIYNKVNIGQLTTELAANFESMAKSLKLEYRMEIPDNFDDMLKQSVFVDLDMYEKIIFNLCSNAFKHTWNGNVTVKLRADKNEDKEVVVLEVSDTGVGIPEDEIPNLFRRFYRIESRQSRSHEGTGIGLALIYELIKRHGGDIECTSTVNQGTTFKIWLPTGHEHLPSEKVSFQIDTIGEKENYMSQDSKLFDSKQLYLEESLQWIQNNEPGFNEENENDDAESFNDVNDDINMDVDYYEMGESDGNMKNGDNDISLSGTKHVVLLVDDNSDMRNYLAGLLRREFTVYCACDGREALRQLKKLKHPPDLILSDIMMPNMDGFELLKNLRSNSATQLIPVILLSAKAGEEASIEGLDQGADDYLTKPFNARELIARVRVNIKLSYLRRQLLLQQRRQAETKQLLFSISNTIHSGFNLKETLSTAVEEIHRILPANRILIEQSDKGDCVVVALSAKDKNEMNLEVQPAIRLQSNPENEKNTNSITSAAIMSSEQNQPELSELVIEGKIEAQDITNEISHLPTSSPCSSLSTSPESQSTSISTVDSTTPNSGNEELEIAVIPNFYSISIQKYVSLLTVTIKVNNSTWGWIKAHRPPNHNWLDSEKEFLQQISNQISLAITHAKLLEDTLKREAQIEAARAANEAKSQILANTSHELRTPLGAIIGVLSAFEDTDMTDDQKDMIQIMSRASDVVLAVVNDILDAAKLEAQKIKLVNRTFDLFDLVEKTVELFGGRAGTKQIELILSCEQSSLPKCVKSDPERLQQILMNLLSNSIKFTEKGQIVLKISISSYEEEIEESSEAQEQHEVKRKAKLFIELCDTGIGIEPAFMKDIFESFSQGDASMTRRQDGTGLGLSICKHLVKINGGDLGVRSELGKGSQFWFTWNVEPLSIIATPIASISQASQLMTSIGPSKEQANVVLPLAVRYKRILIIDSVETARDSLVKLFNDSVNKVDAFDNCEEGINAARQLKEKYNESPYDIVFFNVYLENAELVKNSALQLRSICGQDLSIVLLVFWSVKGRALGRDLMYQIGGHTAALCKPIIQRRLLDCLHNNELFKQTDTAAPSKHDMKGHNSVKSLADIRVEKYYLQNRSLATIKNESDQSADENLNAMIVDQDYDFRKAGANREDTIIGVKRNVNDNNSYAIKSRSRHITKSKHILCVEDNPINLQVIQHQLAKLGYPTLSATNGQEAVNLMKVEFENMSSNNALDNSSDVSSRISLVLMDCAMPIMSGFDASKTIRSMQPPISKIPIIALTASAVQGTRDKCLESGMDDYLTKPLKIGQLKEMLDKWLANE